tara:strand:+ start:2077 stop:2229 length:153 start_codon:yes stop_codon:yes gene_type:complete
MVGADSAVADIEAGLRTYINKRGLKVLAKRTYKRRTLPIEENINNSEDRE